MELNLERREGSRAECPLCRADVLESDRVVCTCGVEYHAACRAELGACATIGCEAAPPVGVTARRGVCCRCGEPVRTRPETCDDCGERHHAWCRTRACEGPGDPIVTLAGPVAPGPGPAEGARPGHAAPYVRPRIDGETVVVHVVLGVFLLSPAAGLLWYAHQKQMLGVLLGVLLAGAALALILLAIVKAKDLVSSWLDRRRPRRTRR